MSFQRFVELLLAQSGGIFEATKFAAPREVSRQTFTKPDLVVVTTDARPAFVRQYEGRRVHFLTPDRLVERITA